MSLYKKNLRRLGWLLIAVSILDVVLELAFYKNLQATLQEFSGQAQSPFGICVKDGIGLLIGGLACWIYARKKPCRWLVRLVSVLLGLEFVSILLSTQGSMAKRVDGLINTTLILSAMVVYTALQLERSERNWARIRTEEPALLDLMLTDARQWFNPIAIGPKLDLNEGISSVVNRFLATAKTPRPLEISIGCPQAVSESMRATMQEVFQMYYEDEERRINGYLERRYIRVMALVIISIVAMTVWINFSPSNDEGVTWTILSNFAAFSLWQIGNTYFERSEGYNELLRAQIAKQAQLHFWAERGAGETKAAK